MDSPRVGGLWLSRFWLCPKRTPKRENRRPRRSPLSFGRSFSIRQPFHCCEAPKGAAEAHNDNFQTKPRHACWTVSSPKSACPIHNLVPTELPGCENCHHRPHHREHQWLPAGTTGSPLFSNSKWLRGNATYSRFRQFPSLSKSSVQLQPETASPTWRERAVPGAR